MGTPATATVHVWVAPLPVGSPAPPPLLACLSPAEQARAGRYRVPADARRFSLSRAGLRHVLGAELGGPPADVALVDGPGKPRLAGAGAGGICFNASRAAELALVAVAGHEVGIDVEQTGRGPRILEAVAVACTAAETAALACVDPGGRPDAFLRLWTAKEAYLKATGVGLAMSPDLVQAAPALDVPTYEEGAFEVAGPGGPTGWWVRGMRPAAGYVGAVAGMGDGWEVRLRHVTELAVPPATGRDDGGR